MFREDSDSVRNDFSQALMKCELKAKIFVQFSGLEKLWQDLNFELVQEIRQMHTRVVAALWDMRSCSDSCFCLHLGSCSVGGFA